MFLNMNIIYGESPINWAELNNFDEKLAATRFDKN